MIEWARPLPPDPIRRSASRRGRLVLETRAQGRYLAWLSRPRGGYFKKARGYRGPAIPRLPAEQQHELKGAELRNPWMTLAAVAGYLSLSESTVRNLMRASHDPLPSVTVGRSRRFALRSVDAWKDRREAREDAVENELENLRARRAAR